MNLVVFLILYVRVVVLKYTLYRDERNVTDIHQRACCTCAVRCKQSVIKSEVIGKNSMKKLQICNRIEQMRY